MLFKGNPEALFRKGEGVLVTAFWVPPKFRQKGIARRLLAEGRKRNPLLRLYIPVAYLDRFYGDSRKREWLLRFLKSEGFEVYDNKNEWQKVKEELV